MSVPFDQGTFQVVGQGLIVPDPLAVGQAVAQGEYAQLLALRCGQRAPAQAEVVHLDGMVVGEVPLTRQHLPATGRVGADAQERRPLDQRAADLRADQHLTQGTGDGEGQEQRR